MTIEEWRESINDMMKKSANDAAKIMTDMSTEIVIAFCAKYHLQPEEAVLCYQGNKFWVDQKDKNMSNIVALKAPLEIMDCANCGCSTFYIQPSFKAVCQGCTCEIILKNSDYPNINRDKCDNEEN